MAKDEKQKKSSIRYMILSVVMAIAVWSLVSFGTDPDIEKTFHGIGVTYIGENALKENGCIAIIPDNLPDLSVKLSGKRGDLIDAIDNIEVEVDVSQIDEPGEYELEGSVHLPSARLSVEKVNFDSVPVHVEEYVTKEVPLTARQTGEISGKLVKSEPEQDTVRVSGAKSETDMVAAAYAVVDLNRIDADNSESVSGIFLADSDGGDVVDVHTITSDNTQVKIENTLYEKVSLPVKLEGGEGITEDIQNASVEPTSLEVGILPGSGITEVYAEVTEAAAGEVECDVKDRAGLYIPPGTEKIKVTFNTDK